MIKEGNKEKPKEKDIFPTCLTFEKEEKITIVDSKKIPLKFLDQRRNIKLIERNDCFYIVELNTFTIDVVEKEIYQDIHKQLFSSTYFGLFEQPSNSQFLCFFGLDLPPQNYCIKILDTKNNLNEKIKTFVRKDQKIDKMITFGILSLDLQLALIVFEDGYLIFIRSNNFCNSTDFREQHFSVNFRPNQFFLMSHDSNKNTVNLLYTDEDGLFLIDKAKIDSFDKHKERSKLFAGKIINSHYEQTSNRIYIFEQTSEDIKIINFDLESKTEISCVRINGEIRASNLLNDHIFLYVYQTSAKNLLTKEDVPPSNHLFIYDMQNKYTAFKQVKGILKIYSVAFSSTSFYYVIQNTAETESKSLIKIQPNSNQDKMNKFIEKSFFDIALRFAENNNFRDLLPKIRSLAGDHYYKMKNYELSVENYIQEIKLLRADAFPDYQFEPNSVITKFLDVSRMPFLIKYLYELHFACPNVVNEYHQQLLVYCYLKKEMFKELNAWLSRMSQSNEYNFKKTVSFVVTSCLFIK